MEQMGRSTGLIAMAMVVATGIGAAQTTQPIHYRPNVVVQLPVANLDKAITFYTEALGFTLSERRDDLGFAHIVTNVPGLELGLSKGDKALGSGGVVVNISVADIVEARRMAEARGVVFAGPTQVIPGKVALAGFRDPDGNRLSFAGPPPKK
jgi:predicted enzyme related to lactoylglutathione lyase